MPEPFPPVYQGGDLILTSVMPDAGVPSALGRAQFVAPCSGQVIAFSMVFEDGLSLATTFNLDFMLFALLNPSLTYTAPATIEGETVNFTLGEGDKFEVGKGQSFEIVSGGEGASTRKGYCTVVFRPNNPTDLPQGAFILTGVNPDGTAAFENDYHCPLPGGGELVYFATALGLTSTATYTATVSKNGTATAASVAIGASGKGTVGEADFNVIDADRHFEYDDHIAITGSAAAGTAGAHAFIAVFRPVGVL